MLIGRIRGSNMVYRAPEGMDNCEDLHVRVDHIPGGTVNSSAWYPTPDEVERIKSGQPIYLHIYGNGHPVVALTVPADDAAG